MALHVQPHVRLSVEAFPTDLAAVRFDSRVRAAVLLQARLVAEASAADVAQKRFLPRVRPDVPQHVVSAVEGFPALIAQKRFLPGVNPHVHLQVSVPVETLTAHFADLPAFVSLQVTFQVFLRIKIHPAHAADICGVTFGVIHQRNHRVEHFPAYFAYSPGLF